MEYTLILDGLCAPEVNCHEIWWPKGKWSERLFFGTLESRTKKAAKKIKINSAEVRV